MNYSLIGFSSGIVLGIIFRRKILMTGFCMGLGAGIALNKCAASMNSIEARQQRLMQSGEENYH